MRIFKSVFNSAYQTIDHYPFSTAFLIIAAICVFAAVRVAMG